MTDLQMQILDSRLQMIALSVTAAILMTARDSGSRLEYDYEHAVTLARTIVFDARTSADAGNYR